jgi:selenide,water dikinase
VRGLPKFTDPNLIVGAESFSDSGVYRLRDDLYIVQTLDFFPPLVDDPFVFGQIAAANSLSDVYAMGAKPITAMNIVGFPDDQLELSILSEILRGGAERVQAAGAVIVGGHTVRDTEIKYGMSITGVVSPDKMLTNSKAQPGDAIVLTKPLGTGFVTTAFKAKHCPDDVLDAAVASMVQLNAAVRDAPQAAGAHAMTDITGFGLAGHAGEVALASGVTIHLEVGRLPLLPGAVELVERGYKTRASASNRAYAAGHTRIEPGVDPLRVEFAFDAQTSGGLLISVPKERASRLVEQAKAGGATASCVIGWVTPREDVAVVLHA